MMATRAAFAGAALWFLGNPTSAGMHADPHLQRQRTRDLPVPVPRPRTRPEGHGRDLHRRLSHPAT